MTEGKRLTLTCSEHGLLHETTVYCRHESEDTVKSVQRAHGADYGGACADGRLHVELHDLDGSDPERVDRILWNQRPTSRGGGGGDIDEIVLHDVTVHIEQMDNRCWWIGVYRDGTEDRFAGNFSADSRGRMTFSMQEDDLPWHRDESHEDRS